MGRHLDAHNGAVSNEWSTTMKHTTRKSTPKAKAETLRRRQIRKAKVSL